MTLKTKRRLGEEEIGRNNVRTKLGTIYLEHNFSKGRVRIWFFGIDWFQIAAIVKWPLVTRLLGEPQLALFWGRQRRRAFQVTKSWSKAMTSKWKYRINVRAVIFSLSYFVFPFVKHGDRLRGCLKSLKPMRDG